MWSAPTAGKATLAPTGFGIEVGGPAASPPTTNRQLAAHRCQAQREVTTKFGKQGCETANSHRDNSGPNRRHLAARELMWRLGNHGELRPQSNRQRAMLRRD